MKILNVNSRSVGQVQIAVPFETDRDVLRASEHLVSRGPLTEFRYDPDVDGEHAGRALSAAYLRRRKRGQRKDDGPGSRHRNLARAQLKVSPRTLPPRARMA